MDIFVARQPIINTKEQVIAYEILYRNNLKNMYDLNQDGDIATATVVTDELTVELIENIIVDDQLDEKCRQLRELGQKLAIDDFTGGDHFELIMPYIDIVKVDFLVLKSEGRNYIAKNI